MAGDGLSFITSVGSRQSSVWVHNDGADRQLSLEGFSFDPEITPDGKRLCYRILKGALPTSDPSELRMADLDSGRQQPLLPGLAVVGIPRRTYDISPDGRELVANVRGPNGEHLLWIVPFDPQSRPHQIPNVEGEHPFFGFNGEVFFRGLERNSAFAYRVHEDGSGLQKVSDRPIAGLVRSSPDSKWLLAKLPGPAGSQTVALPLQQGSAPRVIASAALSFADPDVHWSADAKTIYIRLPLGGEPWAGARTYALPVAPGSIWPKMPAQGFQSEEDVSKVPGAILIHEFDCPGTTPASYAFVRMTVQRNLFRIPLR
jgi:hypothetical protein